MIKMILNVWDPPNNSVKLRVEIDCWNWWKTLNFKKLFDLAKFFVLTLNLAAIFVLLKKSQRNRVYRAQCLDNRRRAIISLYVRNEIK